MGKIIAEPKELIRIVKGEEIYLNLKRVGGT